MFSDWSELTFAENLLDPDYDSYASWDDTQSGQPDPVPIQSSIAEASLPAATIDPIPSQPFPVPLIAVPHPIALPVISIPIKPHDPNGIRKGEGPDSVPDPEGYDGYDCPNCYFHWKLKSVITKAHSQTLAALCKAIRAQKLEGLTHANQWVTRRVACGYAWLDRNRNVITDEVLNTCLMELRQNGIL